MNTAPLTRRARAGGGRMTAQRRAVLQALQELGCAPTAEEIHTRARHIRSGLGLVTVYRTLETFAQEGLVQRLFLDDARGRYELMGGRHHHHLVCLSCGTIQSLNRCFLAAAERAARARGFKVTAHRFELFGYCRRCQAPAAR
ncbi:MAG: transcriptional repressor [Armatimonadetes bacterium]|nr:transcriptional repressor [Armatimonadota bacterium]